MVDVAEAIPTALFQATFRDVLNTTTGGTCIVNDLTNDTTSSCDKATAPMATTSAPFFVKTTRLLSIICSFNVCTDFNYCTAQATATACPSGSFCNSLSANFTYKCTCYSIYSVSGVLSSNPYIEQCTTTTNSVVVVLAIVIPIVFGIALCVAALFATFVVIAF